MLIILRIISIIEEYYRLIFFLYTDYFVRAIISFEWAILYEITNNKELYILLKQSAYQTAD